MVVENLTNAELDALFEKYDKNANGIISFEEFCDACHSIIVTSKLRSPTSPTNFADKAERGFARSVYEKATESDDQEEEEEMPLDIAQLPANEQQSAIKKKAFTMLGIGTFMVLLFSGMYVLFGFAVSFQSKITIDFYIISFA